MRPLFVVLPEHPGTARDCRPTGPERVEPNLVWRARWRTWQARN